MEITIRRATLADAVSLSDVATKTFYDTFTGTCTEQDMQSFLEEYFNVKKVQSELSDEDDFYYLAESAGSVIGYLRFMEDYRNLPLMKEWKAVELKRIYISKEYHGKGVAQQLMNFMLQFATENNYEVVWLGVWEYNLKAQKFYEKYGFVNSGHTHYFPIGNTPQTDFWLWKFL